MREIVDGLKRYPRTCTWELTLRCNLRCGHCGSRAGTARAGEMSEELALRTTAELAALGCQKVSLSGGEPTLSPYWDKVAAEGVRLGMKMNMIVSGVNGGRDLVRRAGNAGLNGLGVSLDGLEATHDRNRGLQGLYGRVMQLIDDCHAVGLSVGVITTVWKGNLHELEAMHDLLAGRVYVWQLQLGAAMGNLSDHRADQIAPEDLLTIVPLVARLVERGQVNVHVADNIGYYGPYEDILRKRRTAPVSCWVGCYAGCRHLGIESDGGVKGCLSIQSTRATEGNLHKDSLRDIWMRPGAFSYNRAFQLDDLSGFCRTCEHAAVCRGGCLSMRTCEGGRDNPFCYHRVATLADRDAERSRARYVPRMVVPAALLAAFGLGCGSDDSAPGPEVKDAAQEWPPAGDAYGITFDGGQDGPDVGAEYYGMPGDAYGIPWDSPPVTDAGDESIDAADETPPAGDAYGIPADADPDTGSWYGMPDQ